MAGHRGLPAQQTKIGGLFEPVVDLLRDAQPFDEPRLRPAAVPSRHRDDAEVHEHPFEVVQVADLAAQPSAFRGRGLRGVEVSLEQRVDGACLEQPHRRGVVVKSRRDGRGLVEESAGRHAISCHVLRGRGKRTAIRTAAGVAPPSGRRDRLTEPWHGRRGIALEDAQPSPEVVRPSRHVRGSLGRREQVIEPADALRRPARDPVVPDRCGELQTTPPVRRQPRISGAPSGCCRSRGRPTGATRAVRLRPGSELAHGPADREGGRPADRGRACGSTRRTRRRAAPPRPPLCSLRLAYSRMVSCRR